MTWKKQSLRVNNLITRYRLLHTAAFIRKHTQTVRQSILIQKNLRSGSWRAPQRNWTDPTDQPPSLGGGDSQKSPWFVVCVFPFGVSLSTHELWFSFFLPFIVTFNIISIFMQDRVPAIIMYVCDNYTIIISLMCDQYRPFYSTSFNSSSIVWGVFSWHPDSKTHHMNTNQKEVHN